MVDSDAIAAVCESCVDVFPDRGVFTAEGIAKVPDGAWAMPINIRFEVRFDGHTLPLACPTPKGWKVRVEMATLDGDVRIRDDAFNDDWLRAENSLADLPKAKLIGVHKWTASVQFKAPNGRTATIRREWKFEVAPAQELMGMK